MKKRVNSGRKSNLNIHAPNSIAPNYRKQIPVELRGGVDSSTVTAGDAVPTSSKGWISQTEIHWGHTGSHHTAGTRRTLHPTKGDTRPPPAHTMHPPAKTTCQATKQVLSNFRRLRSY